MGSFIRESERQECSAQKEGKEKRGKEGEEKNKRDGGERMWGLKKELQIASWGRKKNKERKRE